MRDPLEGLDARGHITTGVSVDRVPDTFAPVVAAAVIEFDRLRELGSVDAGGALLLYGSVATGYAVVGRSDVDLIAYGTDPAAATRVGRELSRRFAAVTREVAFGAAPILLAGDDGDEAYGTRVFLRHYCVTVAGPDRVRGEHDYPGDVRAARGFNGDVARALRAWRRAVALPDVDMDALGRRIGRKLLLAVAGLVSVEQGIWTTDRATAAHHWSSTHPEVAVGDLLALAEGAPPGDQVAALLAPGGDADRIVERFADSIGLWDGELPH